MTAINDYWRQNMSMPPKCNLLWGKRKPYSETSPSQQWSWYSENAHKMNPWEYFQHSGMVQLPHAKLTINIAKQNIFSLFTYLHSFCQNVHSFWILHSFDKYLLTAHSWWGEGGSWRWLSQGFSYFTVTEFPKSDSPPQIVNICIRAHFQENCKVNYFEK